MSPTPWSAALAVAAAFTFVAGAGIGCLLVLAIMFGRKATGG